MKDDKNHSPFEFSPKGWLKAVYLNAANDLDQKILERALGRLIKPSSFRWLKGLFFRKGIEANE